LPHRSNRQRAPRESLSHSLNRGKPTKKKGPGFEARPEV
jgi:hypothetical protein